MAKVVINGREYSGENISVLKNSIIIDGLEIELESKEEKIKVELLRSDVINMLKGVNPNYSLFDKLASLELGYFIGGFEEKWVWKETAFDRYNIQQLLGLYNTCKESWL